MIAEANPHSAPSLGPLLLWEEDKDEGDFSFCSLQVTERDYGEIRSAHLVIF